MVSDRAINDQVAVMEALESGMMTSWQIRKKLGIRLYRVFRALDALMAAKVVADIWVPDPDRLMLPERRFYYRVSDAER